MAEQKTGEFVRAVTLPDDSELLTRHEVQVAPPDLLVTNYSMLEYMLMRPIERPIFDKTRDWLDSNPDEKFLVVLDEAHLYRGAAGAEVGLLLRRLRDRLGIPEDRFQVICATASFKDHKYAPQFGAQLSGIPASTFIPVTGTLDLRPHCTPARTTMPIFLSPSISRNTTPLTLMQSGCHDCGSSRLPSCDKQIHSGGRALSRAR